MPWAGPFDGCGASSVLLRVPPAWNVLSALIDVAGPPVHGASVNAACHRPTIRFSPRGGRLPCGNATGGEARDWPQAAVSARAMRTCLILMWVLRWGVGRTAGAKPACGVMHQDRTSVPLKTGIVPKCHLRRCRFADASSRREALVGCFAPKER